MKRNVKIESRLTEKEIEKAHEEVSSLLKVIEEQDVSASVKAKTFEVDC